MNCISCEFCSLPLIWARVIMSFTNISCDLLREQVSWRYWVWFC